jgi:hypothetical protein
MKLKDFIKQLNMLVAQGHHEKQVFYRHSASGDCGLLSSAHVSNEVSDEGPFDLEPGEEYISITAGGN